MAIPDSAWCWGKSTQQVGLLKALYQQRSDQGQTLLEESWLGRPRLAPVGQSYQHNLRHQHQRLSRKGTRCHQSQSGWHSHWAGHFDSGQGTFRYSYHSSIDIDLCLLFFFCCCCHCLCYWGLNLGSCTYQVSIVSLSYVHDCFCFILRQHLTNKLSRLANYSVS